jgi:uroporphyrinogen-III synthase
MTHYPVIRTILRVSLDEVLKQDVEQCTHWLFTSPNAVRHWFRLVLSKHSANYIAVGAATAAALEKFGVRAMIAPFATQEGVIALLDTLDLGSARIGWPRSSRARPVLANYLTKRGLSFVGIDLYETVAQRVEPVPDLRLFDEIVFTSPSTVDAFFEIFGHIPSGKKIVAIGPVTADRLAGFF